VTGNFITPNNPIDVATGWKVSSYWFQHLSSTKWSLISWKQQNQLQSLGGSNRALAWAGGI